MRQLARFDDEERARTLGDALYLEGIDNRVDATRDGSYLLWVVDEAQLEKAKSLYQLFEQDPDDIRFKKARREASVGRKSAQREEKKRNSQRAVNVRESWKERAGIGPFSMALIVICVGLFLLTNERMGGRSDIAQLLYIDSRGGLATAIYGYFSDVRSGQVWRLVTPALMHGGFMHIIFNMWWLKDLGTLVERRYSTGYLVAMFFTLSILSNVAQYLVSGPNFLGMSGVVYGLFGFVWMRGRFDPRAGFALNQTTVAIMIGFYVLCWTGLLGPIANIAHTGGLVVGAAWGYLSSGDLKRRLR